MPPPNNNNNNSGGGDDDHIQVAVRIRPLLPSEYGNVSCIDIIDQQQTTVRIGGQEGPQFCFDRAFDGHATQYDVYQTKVVPLLQSCLEGYNATVLAYGQTGSGKTHSIMGSTCGTSDNNSDDDDDDDDDDDQAGIIPRALDDLFQHLDALTNNNGNEGPEENDNETTVDVRVQFLELYGEDIRDLLTSQHRTTSTTTTSTSTTPRNKKRPNVINPSKLTIREIHNEPEVLGATTQKVTSAEEALLCLTRGMLRRVTGATAMNSSSSRSHAILSLQIEISEGNTSRRSKFNFVDLAGSERQKRTQSSGQRLKEGIDINKGLLVLGNVISALTASEGGGSSFVPYRDSKLTRLLKGSLGGNHKTLMLACVSPSSSNLEESINCLRYANRAKNIQNNAIVNLDAGSQLVLELKDMIHNLASVLLIYVQDYGQYPNNSTTSSFSMETLQQLVQDYHASTTTTTTPKKKSSHKSKSQSRYSSSKNFVSPTFSSSSTTTTSPQRIIPRPPLVDIPPTGTSTFPNHYSPSQQPQPHSSYQETEQELGRIRELLRQSKRELTHTQEELYATKAEKELYRLQLPLESTSMAENNPEDDIPQQNTKENHPQDIFLKKALGYEKEISILKQSLRNANAQLEHQQPLYNHHNHHNFRGEDNSTMIPPPPPPPPGALTPSISMSSTTSSSSPVITRATKILQDEKAQLSQLQQEHSMVVLNDQGELGHASSTSAILKAKALQSLSPSLQLDAEEAAEEAALHQMKQKYIVDDDDEGDEDGNNQEDGNADKVFSPSNSSPKTSTPTSSINNKNNNKRQVRAHLFELSTSIAAKEELIEQLEMSLQKYAAMREFYETKLTQMEEQVAQREAERLQLLEELKKVDNNDKHQTGDLEEKLKAKETHIATLRKRTSELANLTQVSSQNEADIDKLQRDVKDMKQKKVDLQKMLTQNNKVHATEMKRMKKDIVQKDRETAKLRKELTVKSTEASKAKLVAKARLEELSALRTKFKESEKKLRMQTIKRRMMEKAGLDSVMVGRTTNTAAKRRNNNNNNGNNRRSTTGRPQYSYGRPTTNSKTRNSKDSQESSSSSQPQPPKAGSSGAAACIDFDALRDYLDEKVADVGRKETIALKIASEWEDHYAIVQQRDELVRQTKNGGGNKRQNLDRIEALEIQAQYKEKRIRLFSKRLGRGKNEKNLDNNDSSSAEDAIFRDVGFKSICKGISGTNAVKSAARALFGMVVRERRRVISLAKTASQLDARLVQTKGDLAEKEEAIRTYVDEERIERSNMALNQQEKILSLMELVKLEDKTTSSETSKNSNARKDGVEMTASEEELQQHIEEDRTRNLSIMGQSSSKMLIMANERVSVLEEQLRDLEGAHEAIQDYHEKEKTAKAMLSEKTSECDSLKKNNADLHSALRKVHEYLLDIKESMTEDTDDNDNFDEEGMEYLNKVLDVAVDTLKEGSKTPSSSNKTTKGFVSSPGQSMILNSNVLTPSLSRHIEMMESTEHDGGDDDDDDDDGEGEDDPDWANDIMKDLAIIADGGLPSAHRERTLSSSSVDKQVFGQEASVFDRLTHPGNFTGVQKQKTVDSSNSRPKRDATAAAAAAATTTATATATATTATRLESPLGLAVDTSSGSPSKSSTSQSIPPGGKERNKKDDKNESKDEGTNDHRSVFERLVSPSNYTGTHKEKALVLQQQVKEAEEEASLPETEDDLLDELLADDVEEEEHDDDDLPNYEVPSSSAEDLSVISKSKNVEYAGKDVFERLQNTMTQSYAVKTNHNHNPVRSTSLDLRSTSCDLSSLASGMTGADDQHISPPKNVIPREVHYNADHHHHTEKEETNSRSNSKETMEDYTKKNVFERLQQTTTQAYAKKKNPTIDYHAIPWNHDHKADSGGGGGPTTISSTASVGDSSHHTDMETYTQQNVFERLQNTVTAAYAVRKNVIPGGGGNKPPPPNNNNSNNNNTKGG